MSDVLTAALEAYDAGLCTIKPRTDGSKRPAGTWEHYQTARPSRDEVTSWFGSHPGLGLVCGAVSGNLEMLELEGKAIVEGLAQRLVELVKTEGLADVWRRITAGYTETTPSGGRHILFRVDGAPLRNTKLARRPATAEELAADPDNKLITLIETRGEGGFTIVAPSNGAVHPKGGAWTQRTGSFTTIATVTTAERDALYDLCRRLDETVRTPSGITVVEPAGKAQHHSYKGDAVGESWMDAVVEHLAATDTMAAALERYGWAYLRDDGDGCPLYRRPGQPNPRQHGGKINASGRLAVYSSSTPFDEVTVTRTTYDLLDVYAAYEHRGDRQAAAKAIAESTGIYAAWSGRGASAAWSGRGASATPPPGVDPETGEVAAMNLAESFWEERPIFAHSRQAAQHRQMSPDAVLANNIARAATLIPPSFRLPAVIGAEATLDFIACVVADTSGGKSGAHGVARGLIPEPDHDPDDDRSWQVMMDLPVGSGEGIAQAFMVPELKPDDAGKLKPTGRQVVGREALHLVVDEGTAFVNQAQRNGTTIIGTLASAWSGQALGNLNASAETRRLIAGGRVRVTAVINMQAANGHLLLAPQFESVGLTGRILFASAHDPSAPAIDELPEWPGPLEPPVLSSVDQTLGVFHYDPEIVWQIRTERHTVLTGSRVIDKRRSQTVLLRCKVAAILAYWEGRLDVTVDDWRLAGMILDASGAVLPQDAADEKHRAVARGIADAVAETARERRLVADLSARIVERIPDGGIGRGELGRALTSKHTRHRFDPALDLAVANGYLIVDDGHIERAPT